MWRYLIGYKNLLRAIENLGIAVVYGIRYYGQGNLTQDNYIQFIKHDTLSSAYLNQSINFVAYVRKNFEKIKKVYTSVPISNFSKLDLSRRGLNTGRGRVLAFRFSALKIESQTFKRHINIFWRPTDIKRI